MCIINCVELILIISCIYFRKEHEIKINSFCEWLNEFDSKVNKCNIVISNSIEEILKKLHSFTDEHTEKQPLFTEIKNDFKHFFDNALTQQSVMQFQVRILIKFGILIIMFFFYALILICRNFKIYCTKRK